MPDPTLYLFDGYNILHAGGFRGPADLVDRLADFVAMKGARGIVVFDGGGDDRAFGRLEVRYASHADALLERLAAEHRIDGERLPRLFRRRRCAARPAMRWSSDRRRGFLSDFEQPQHEESTASRVGDRVDEETRAALERTAARREKP